MSQVELDTALMARLDRVTNGLRDAYPDPWRVLVWPDPEPGDEAAIVAELRGAEGPDLEVRAYLRRTAAKVDQADPAEWDATREAVRRAHAIASQLPNARLGSQSTRWLSRRHWPPSIPMPLLCGGALDLVEQARPEIAAAVSAEVARLVGALVAPKLAGAVLARCAAGWRAADGVVRAPAERWPWPVGPEAAGVLGILLAAVDLGDDPASGLAADWPPEAAPIEVARWAREALNRCGSYGGEALGDLVVARVADGFGWPTVTLDENRYSGAAVALLFLAERDVRHGLARPMVAVSASKEHHEMLTGVRTMRDPKRARKGSALELEQVDGRFILTHPGIPAAVQLAMPYDGVSGHEAVILRLKEMHGPDGAKYVRHWAALQALWSIQGGRQGWVRWTLDAHLSALGLDSDSQRRAAVRSNVAAEVEHLTRLEVVRLDDTGKRRYEAPLIHVGERERERIGETDEWRLDGMIFRANPLIYGGVRNQETGAIGRDWIGIPEELAKINHVQHPHAHALGLLLAIRSRWTLGPLMTTGEGPDRVTLSGGKLLELAGIPAGLRADRAWSALRRDLGALEGIGMLGSYSWSGEPWSRTGMISIRLAPWILDRTVRRLVPDVPERPPIDLPLTGAELVTWREARGWSQRETARRLGVGQASVSRAEAAPAVSLGPALRAALKRSTDHTPSDSKTCGP